MRNIMYINDYLSDRGMRHGGVQTIDVVPKLPRHFLQDQVHFNDNGKQLQTALVMPSDWGDH